MDVLRAVVLAALLLAGCAPPGGREVIIAGTATPGTLGEVMWLSFRDSAQAASGEAQKAQKLAAEGLAEMRDELADRRDDASAHGHRMAALSSQLEAAEERLKDLDRQRARLEEDRGDADRLTRDAAEALARLEEDLSVGLAALEADEDERGVQADGAERAVTGHDRGERPGDLLVHLRGPRERGEIGTLGCDAGIGGERAIDRWRAREPATLRIDDLPSRAPEPALLSAVRDREHAIPPPQGQRLQEIRDGDILEGAAHLRRLQRARVQPLATERLR